ncbi:MAG: sensor histidine kinase, partial [Terriglobales bacterium]
MSSTTSKPAAALRSAEEHKANLDCLAGSGEACALARSVDWGRTSIGRVEGWSQALRSTAALVLHNHSAMLLWWGPEFVQIYNDVYRPVLGDKHPRAMGQRFRDCWSEVFHILGPMAERPFRGGPASTSDDIAVPIHRKVPREEAHFRLAYSPVPDESIGTGIGGVLATVAEITEQAYSDRQIHTLRDLGAHSAAPGATTEQACAVAAQTLKENAWDVPFALFYLLDERGGFARLVASAGFDGRPMEQAAPAEVDLSAAAESNPWPILRAARERRVEIVTSLSVPQAALPASPWADPPTSAIALPLAAPEQAHAYGVLICGVSPHRVLDEGYRTFFELAAGQIVTAIRNARALEEERKRAEALAEIDRTKTAFFSNISHEFRTPLTLLLGPVEDAAADPATPVRVRQQLELAHRNSLRLHKLVNSLLDFSRIEAGRVQTSFEPSDLAALTGDLASTFRSAIERAGLTFTVECAELGEPVHIDREMWEKIVLNLLSNAFKFTLHGSIAVRLRREEDGAVLEVCDTGSGIPPQELPRLFER